MLRYSRNNVQNDESAGRRQKQESGMLSGSQFLSDTWWKDKASTSIKKCSGDQWDTHFCKHSEFSEGKEEALLCARNQFHRIICKKIRPLEKCHPIHVSLLIILLL